LLLAGFAAVLLSSCYNGTYEPYLVIDINDEYPVGTVTVAYSFRSERSEQSCLVRLTMNGSEEYIYSSDGRLAETGTLMFNDLGTGWYSLYFAVLSEKGRTPSIIPFLEQNHSFLVR